ASNPEGTPLVLLHHFKHNRVLHQQVILLSVLSPRVPEVPPNRRLKIVDRGQGFFQVSVSYGYMQTPNVPKALEACAAQGLRINPEPASYCLAREPVLPTG